MTRNFAWTADRTTLKLTEFIFGDNPAAPDTFAEASQLAHEPNPTL